MSVYDVSVNVKSVMKLCNSDLQTLNTKNCAYINIVDHMCFFFMQQIFYCDLQSIKILTSVHILKASMSETSNTNINVKSTLSSEPLIMVFKIWSLNRSLKKHYFELHLFKFFLPSKAIQSVFSYCSL